MLRPGKHKEAPTTVERVIKSLDIHPKIKKRATEESSSGTGAFRTPHHHSRPHSVSIAHSHWHSLTLDHSRNNRAYLSQ